MWVIARGPTCTTCVCDQGDRKAKGSAELTIDSIVEQDLQVDKEYCFNLITRSRKYIFQAKNKEEMDVWMTAIAHNISGLVLGE